MSGRIQESNAVLPGWMLEPAPAVLKKGLERRGSGFIRKTLQEIKTTLAGDMRIEHLAAQPGLIQKIDPRIKLLGLIILVTASGMTRSLTALVFLALLSASLMVASKLPVLTLQTRIWGIIPVISLLAAAPGMLSIFNPGAPLLVLLADPQGLRIGSLHLAGPIYISRQGVEAAAFLFMRTGLSLSLGTLLVLTTPIASLLRSISVLRVPTLLVMIVEMSYRYLILLITISLEMYEARKMRTVGSISGKQQRMLAGSSLAALFNRSMVLSEEVYQSMTCRGYTGEAVYAQNLALCRLDYASAVAVFCLAIITVWGGSIFDWLFIFSQ